ncbi:MAG: FAD:protein FMN transferase [Bacteroidales bacterium]|nr:FAD:protein FMN transferase [Candidatus Cacconaster merdequi]
MLCRIFNILLPSLILLTVANSCGNASGYAKVGGYAQGGTYSISLKLPEDVDASHIQHEADSILLVIDNSLSGYNKGSLLSRLNSGEDLPLDDVFVECFTRSKEVFVESGGAFDPSAAPLFDLWGFGFSEGGEVSKAAVDSIMQFTGMDKLTLERREDGVHLKRSDSRIRLNFNAIAQGLSCDIIARALESHGCTDYLVEVGREIVCRGKRENGEPWHVGIDKPVDSDGSTVTIQDVISLSDRGIVTSGNYHKFYIKDGQKFAHTIDPRKGFPVQHTLLSATVIAEDATLADACATWFMVIGLEEAMSVVSQRNDIEAYLVYGDQEDMKVWESDGLRSIGNQ